MKLLFLFESTITYLFFKYRILKILFKINVKIFHLFDLRFIYLFIELYNVLLYLTFRPVFCIETIVN